MQTIGTLGSSPSAPSGLRALDSRKHYPSVIVGTSSISFMIAQREHSPRRHQRKRAQICRHERCPREAAG